MIGWLEKTVIDCPDPRALATFYAELLGMRVNQDGDDWVIIGRAPGSRPSARRASGSSPTPSATRSASSSADRQGTKTMRRSLPACPPIPLPNSWAGALRRVMAERVATSPAPMPTWM
jgi:hypothetical protein